MCRFTVSIARHCFKKIGRFGTCLPSHNQMENAGLFLFLFIGMNTLYNVGFHFPFYFYFF